MASAPTVRRAETRSISIEASPERVLEIVGDPLRLPDWAPDLARSIKPDAEAGTWLIDTGFGESRVQLRVHRESGTVDLLGIPQPQVGERGSFARVLSNGPGSEFVFTLFFGPAVGEPAIARQMKLIDEELARVKALAEAPA